MGTQRSWVEQVATTMELPPFFKTLGLTLVEATEERAVVRMDVPDSLLTPHERVHGGVIAALIDTACGIAVVTRLAPGDRTATYGLDVHYTSFSQERVIFCTAQVADIKRSVATVEAEVRTEKGLLVAKALATFGVRRGATAH